MKIGSFCSSIVFVVVVGCFSTNQSGRIFTHREMYKILTSGQWCESVPETHPPVYMADSHYVTFSADGRCVILAHYSDIAVPPGAGDCVWSFDKTGSREGRINATFVGQDVEFEIEGLSRTRSFRFVIDNEHTLSLTGAFRGNETIAFHNCMASKR